MNHNMKKCKHKFEFDGGPCIKCGKTVSDLFLEDGLSPTERKLKEKGLKWEPVELDPNWYEKMQEETRQAEMKALKEEEERIEKMSCPSCKSTDKDHIVKSEDNGIYGPGFCSWVIDEYYVCKKCGTMYKDLNKKPDGFKRNFR
jgi:hypothetical protein